MKEPYGEGNIGRFQARHEGDVISYRLAGLGYGRGAAFRYDFHSQLCR